MMAKTLIHFVKYFMGLEGAQTQTTPVEREAIKRHAVGKRRVVEIGVFEGVTTGAIASALPSDATLFAIDPFLSGRIGFSWGKAIARSEVKRSRSKCKIQFVEEFSHEANRTIDGTFDLVFIDGDHSWDGISRDWQDWSGRVDPGGLIALHDSLVPAHNPRVATLGSHKFFVEKVQHDDRFEIVEQVESLSILRRKSLN